MNSGYAIRFCASPKPCGTALLGHGLIGWRLYVLVELLLNPERFVVGLDRPYELHQVVHGEINQRVAAGSRRSRRIARIASRQARHLPSRRWVAGTVCSVARGGGLVM